MTHDDEDIPTIGAYVPPPPGGGGSDGSSGSPWGKGDSSRRDDDDDDLDDESLEAGRPDDADDTDTPAASDDADTDTPAASGDADTDAPAASEGGTSADAGGSPGDTPAADLDLATPQKSVQPGSSAYAPTRGLTDAGAPAAAAAADSTPAEPGMTFVSTAGNPDVAPATYGEGDDEVPARIGGRFEVLELLGKGGMGRVYRVNDKHISGRELALKVLHKRYSESPYFKELFFREIKTAQGFVSEHVNQVRDTGITDEGQLFLTMDLVEGETLRSLMRREHSLGVRHALEICRQVLLGLQSGHDQGFIHRDVKPENVMLASKVAKTDENPFGVGARLLDFGLAGLAAELEEGGTHGTPMYMSPEQAKGERLDPRSDLFAVGTLLFELLVGSRPFHGKTVANVLTSVIETDATPLINQIEHVDKRVRKLLRKALAKKRDDRFQSAAEFIKAIEKAPAFQPPTEMPAWAGAAIAVLLVAAGGSAFMWWQAQQDVKTKAGTIDSLNASLAAATTRKTGELGADADTQRKIAELNRSNDDLNTRNDTLAEQLAAARDELEALRREQGLEETGDRSRITTLESQVANLGTQMGEIQSERDSLKAKVAELELVQKAYNSQNDPQTRAAQGFDKLLSQVESGFLGRAHKTMAQLVDAEVFAESDGLPGKELVEPLGEACLAMANFDAADELASKRVYFDAARADFDAAQQERGPFELAAADWLAFRASAADPDPARLDRLDRVLEALGTRLGGMEVEAVASTENLWAQIENGPADQDPTRAFQIAFQSDGEPDEQLRALAKRFRNHLQGATGEGLDAAALAQADKLPVWAALLDDPRHYAVREWPVSKDLVLAAFARAWLSGESPPPPSQADLNVSGSAPSQPAWDWRREAWLKARLVTTNAAWPLRPTKVAVFRRETSIGSVQWIVERGTEFSGNPEQGGASWGTKRSLHVEKAGRVDSRPDRDDPITYTLHPGRIFDWLNGSADADLKYAARVVRYERPGGELPAALGVSTGEVERFADALGDADRACLVIEDDDGSQRWISPELGLVRVVTGEGDARQVTELVYTNVVR